MKRHLPLIDGDAVSIRTDRPLVALIEPPHWDDEGYQRAKRINGSFVCPDCGLVWPLYEDVDCWVNRDGKHYAKEWSTGYGYCEECAVGVFEGFDTDYVLRGKA